MNQQKLLPMKKICYFLFIAATFVAFSCGNASVSVTTTDDKDSASGAVCIWDNISLKESPEEAGKWICAISIGEVVTYLDDSKEDNSGKKPVKYVKVKLKDGKEGWAMADFIILNSKPAAVTEDLEMYSRPDLLNKTGKSFMKMDIIAVKSEKDGFIEVTGKRKDGKWIESGWLKGKSVSYDAVDIAVAKFAGKALEIKDTKKREEAINEILKNSDFNNSVFISSLSQPQGVVSADSIE
jgi:hypothetical protein